MYKRQPLTLDAVELVLKRALHTRNLETANQELTTRIQADSGLQKLLGRSAACLLYTSRCV